MSFLFEISLIVILIGIANSSIGVFLVLNDKSMISFALSHAVLLGIIISYGIIPDLYSPIFIIISSIIGFIIVSIVELLNKVKFIEYNSALGFVYLTVFAISVILISSNDLDMYYSLESIVSGQLLYLPFFRTTFLGIDLPSIAWTMISLIIINITFII
ncbi:MAG: metal ABC transporter permease, partial [Candidatus Kariarchaeum pelagius]